MNQEDIREIVRVQLTDAGIGVVNEHLDIAIEFYNLNGEIPHIDYIVAAMSQNTPNNNENNENNENNPPNEPVSPSTNPIVNIIAAAIQSAEAVNPPNNDDDNEDDDEEENVSPRRAAIPRLYSQVLLYSRSSQNSGSRNPPQRINLSTDANIVVINEQQLQNDIVKKVIDNIENVKLDIVKEKNNINDCIVCYDNFVETDLVRILPCKHMAHRRCIDDYLTNESYLCPMCKTPAGKYKLTNL